MDGCCLLTWISACKRFRCVSRIFSKTYFIFFYSLKEILKIASKYKPAVRFYVWHVTKTACPQPHHRSRISTVLRHRRCRPATRTRVKLQVSDGLDLFHNCGPRWSLFFFSFFFVFLLIFWVVTRGPAAVSRPHVGTRGTLVSRGVQGSPAYQRRLPSPFPLISKKKKKTVLALNYEITLPFTLCNGTELLSGG